LGMITGYSIFYEGSSVAQTVSSSSSSGSLVPPPTPFPIPVRQVFGSFELIAAPAEPLAVEITSSDTEGVAPASFDFEANVTGGTVPYTYSWDFGDGSVESDDDETISHTFDVAGTYNVDLTVTDSTGRTVSDSILITVDAPPTTTEPEPEPEPPNADQGGTVGGTSPAVDSGPTTDDDNDDGGGGGGTFGDCIVPPGRDPGDVGC
jgi:PKD repeat protein